jgi:hybrid polyketide synthase / nonribosomal peptide synthetase ACE1
MRQYLDDQSAPNFTFWIQVRGSIQADKLQTALDLVCRRHEALQTCFFAYNGEACQGIMKKSAIQLERKTISGQPELLGIIERGETLRMVLCEESADSFYLIVGYHHIAMDGFSWEVLFSDLEKAYKNRSLSPAPRQYSEWAASQLKSVENGDVAAERDYWRKEFQNSPTLLPLFPMAQVNWRRPIKKYEQHKNYIKLDSSLTTLIKETCRSQKVTTFHFHLAVFKTLLFRFLGINDLCIGIADANRTDDTDMSMIGLMLNLLPLRFQLNARQSFIAALREVRTKVFSALAHSRVPFNVILEDIGVPRSSTHSPLFQAFIDYRQANKTTFADFEGYTPLGSVSHSKVPYDVCLNVLENYTGESIVTVGAQASLYSEADTEVIAKSYFNLLETFAKHPATRMANSQLFTKVEMESAIELGRGM